jgi:hypothetical protein
MTDPKGPIEIIEFGDLNPYSEVIPLVIHIAIQVSCRPYPPSMEGFKGFLNGNKWKTLCKDEGFETFSREENWGTIEFIAQNPTAQRYVCKKCMEHADYPIMLLGAL